MTTCLDLDQGNNWREPVSYALQNVLPVIRAPMVKAAEMIDNHVEGVAAHWNSGLTNALMEGLNSVFQVIKRNSACWKGA